MKKNLMKGVVAASASLLAFGAVAGNLFEQCDLVPYVGADAQWRHMEFKKGFGKDQTKSNYPQGNIYLGLKLNQYLGLEAGYERAKTLKRDTSALGSDVNFGAVFVPGAPNQLLQINTKTKLRAFHANVVGFLPICEEYRLQLIGSLGIARVNINTSRNVISVDNIALTDTEAASVQQVFSKKKWVPRIGIGLQHMLTCQLGVRAMANWEGTSMTLKTLDSLPVFSARTKNSLNLGLGLFYNFK